MGKISVTSPIVMGVCKTRNPPGTCRNHPEPTGTTRNLPRTPGTLTENQNKKNQINEPDDTEELYQSAFTKTEETCLFAR